MSSDDDIASEKILFSDKEKYLSSQTYQDITKLEQQIN